MCPLGALRWVCDVLGPLAPVHQCPGSPCYVACAVSWATWLLFTGVPARCAVLHVQSPGQFGLCSPVCLLGVLCCGYGVMAPWILFTGVLARCVVPWVVCAGERCGAHTRPSGHRLFGSPQGLGTLWAHTRPSGRRQFCSPQGLGSLPGAHTSVRTASGVAWHLFPCRRSLRVVRALLVCGTRRPLLLGTCLYALFVAGGVPLWRASWPRVVRRTSSLSVLRSAFLTRWCLSLPLGLAPPALLGGCAGHAKAGREPASLCLPLAPAEAGALGSLRVVPVRGAAMGLSLAGPSGVGLGLRALRWLACVDPVTDVSGFPYRPSFDEGLGRCTGAVSCGRRHLN